ncbi:MAG: MFS transporter [Candidatus Latescibacterota bacterium]|nr:MAG: MFS transporter [Candidatus Latescibacteria bacterium 4484_107]RKY72030.1 MAG: MFS transporter [Candidatus Latescibacterota bacterium]
MSNQDTMNRWFVVVGAVLIQLCLGAIYAWSVFTKKITLAIADGGLYGFSATQAAWVFSAGLATFAVVMVLAGRLQAKVGPRPIAVAGGIVLGIGYMLGGFLGRSFAAQLLCIGVIGGAGIGLAYVVPIAVGVKWFPDKKGMITGLAVAGFGFGATLWVKLAGSWFGGLLNTTHIFGLPGVQSVFFIYGVVFLVFVLLGSIVMVNPPAGYKPKGWNPPEATGSGKATGAVDLTSSEMLKTPQYYMLLLMFIGSGLAGLMVIYCIRLFGIDALQASGAAKAAAAGTIAGTAMAWYAILNGLGRIVWGTVSDKIGRKFSLFLMCLFQGIIMLLFFKLGATPLGLIIGACLIGFNFGGNFALFPAATADFFGNKNVGTNYGWVFLAYGVAGIAGPQVAGHFKDAAQGGDVSAWITPFIIAGISCLIAAGLALMLKTPKRS